jgi:peroxiredoxin
MSLLKIQQPAPFFEHQDIFGQTVNLQNYQGRWLLLSFYRYVGCPFCNLRFVQILQDYKKYSDAGLQFISIFESTPAYVLEYVTRRKPPMPVIADPQGELYALYGLKRSWLGVLSGMFHVPKMIKAFTIKDRPFQGADVPINRMPADFLITANGRLEIIHYGRDMSDHLPFAQLNQVLRIKK